MPAPCLGGVGAPLPLRATRKLVQAPDAAGLRTWGLGEGEGVAGKESLRGHSQQGAEPLFWSFLGPAPDPGHDGTIPRRPEAPRWPPGSLESARSSRPTFLF